ncbi:SpoIIE family protein phosphatase [Actinoplanes sp. CA-030573]|uniref:SpoIIE family protein phosphatase n=1 Tax=Actinoplanes sp. CA-030573 TaxID=3239898 RepID=UPI003D9384B9
MRDLPSDDMLSRTVGDAGVVRRVFDEMPLMVIAFEGPDLRIVAATGAYRAYVGRPAVVGVPLREAFPDVAGQQVLEIFERVYETGEPAALREFRVRMDRPDLGRQVETFVDFNVNPRRSADGRVIGVVCDIVDVTAQVRRRQEAQQRAADAERRYAEARHVIDTLQRELLPAGLPLLPRAQIAASYLLADADNAAGGDWFDAVPLTGGRVALAIGDVVGHGVGASAAMGQLRVLLNERLATTGDLRTALAAVDRMAPHIRGARAATVCLALLDPATGEFAYCTAGHPPPLVVPRTGEARYLPLTGAGPLGVRTPGSADADFVCGAGRLADGDLFVLYTDGILERPGRTFEQSSVELLQAATDIAADRALYGDEPTVTERVCVQTVELLSRVTGYSDDITLLAAQRVAAPPGFAMRTPATLEALQDIREALGGWLSRLAVSDRDFAAVQHSVNELITNAIQHAYAEQAEPSTLAVTATLSPSGQLHATVRDGGCWRVPRRSPERGIGLTMVSNLVDSLGIEHDGTGTVATVRHQLTRPARLLTGPDLAGCPSPRRRPAADPFLIIDDPSAPTPRLRIDGPIDARTAPELDAGLQKASAAGTRELTVDLTGVTCLASAGVAVLHRLTARNSTGGGLRLYAPTGSPADLVMTVVHLPHLTTAP